MPRCVKNDETFMALPSMYKGMATYVDIFGIASSWLIDTGCPKGIAPETCKDTHPESVYPSSSHTFETAAGDAESEGKIKFEAECLEGKSTACLLEKAPPVLTVGGRNKSGYTYIWVAGHGPCWILPSGKLLPLKQSRGLSYLNEDGPHTDPNIDAAAVSGLTIVDGIASFSIYGKYLSEAKKRKFAPAMGAPISA